MMVPTLLREPRMVMVVKELAATSAAGKASQRAPKDWSASSRLTKSLGLWGLRAMSCEDRVASGLRLRMSPAVPFEQFMALVRNNLGS